MAPRYIMRPQLSGRDRLGGARQDRGFPLYKNAFLEPIDCEQFDLLNTGDWRAAMDADVERFFEECRADPWFRDQPEALKGHEEIFEEFYLAGDESPEWQEIWDRIREVVTRKEPLMERVKALIPILEKIKVLMRQEL
jgi:hypothetical protein